MVIRQIEPAMLGINLGKRLLWLLDRQAEDRLGSAYLTLSKDQSALLQ